MRNDLAPIAKHLILMFSSCTEPLTPQQIRAKLPDADESCLWHELLMLARAEIVCRGVSTQTCELVYWYAGNRRPASVVYWLQGTAVSTAASASPGLVVTDADVAGIAPRAHGASPDAPALLERAACHMRDRAAQYDKPAGERSMGATVHAFNAVTGRDLRESEGWLLLQLLKNVRLFQHPGYHADSAEDCIAYAALMGESKAREAEAVHE
jgi:hypothetical protein